MSTFEFVEVGLPASDDREAWKEFWRSKNQPWRTEPRISKERQEYLTERRKIKPDIDQDIYPFKVIKLFRADVEWLLSTHDNYHGPVDWNNESQRERWGLDLRGADLREEKLNNLPLARIIAGAVKYSLERPIETATIHLEKADLRAAHLEGAYLPNAHLEGAKLNAAYLEGADLQNAHLEGADLQNAHLEGADLQNAHLEGASLRDAHLEGAHVQRAHLEKANLISAHLEGASLRDAHLEDANLQNAHLEEASLATAHLEGAHVQSAHLEGAYLSHAHLEGAYLSAAFFDSATNLERVCLSNKKYGTASLCDIHWGDVNVAVVDWSKISKLGDENDPEEFLYRDQNEIAARAYRQLSIVLRNQGLNEHAARFAYRAQLMQRKVFWFHRKVLSFLGSLFLDLLSGYGYKVGRCFIAYALVIGVFATIYHLLGTHPVWNESIVISMTAFHGRGFFPEQFHPGDPQALAAAIEAFVGLLIEITLIATLTQRFFGK